MGPGEPDGAATPVLKRMRRGEPAGAAADPQMRPWVIGSLLALAASAVLPVLSPASEDALRFTTPLLSLFCFLAAVGHWLRMGRRTFPVALFLTAVVYGLGVFTPFGTQDIFWVALLSSFLVFALAGFNLVFILEEVVFDVQRLAHFRNPAWRFGPTLGVILLAWLLPVLARNGPWLRATWITALIATVVMGGWWFLRAFNTIDEGPVLKELHLLVVGSMCMAGVMDGIRLLGRRDDLLPSFVAYATLIGSWIYVSYTTLQRTHFLLRGRNELSWLLIMMSASFALVQHAYLHYRAEGALGITVLLNQRLAYLVVGIGVGMGVYLAQAVWRVTRSIRDDRRVSPRGRIIAGRLARLAEGIFFAERRILHGGAYQLYAGVERLLPGEHRAPQHWELDPDTGTVTRVDAAFEEE